MKTSNMVKLSLVVVAVAFVSSVTGYIFGVHADSNTPKETVPNEKVVESTSQEDGVVAAEPEQKSITQTYLLRETDGSVALYYKYSDGNEKLYRTYDISVKSLPQSDRELLKEGIEVDSLSEALQLIEDYM